MDGWNCLRARRACKFVGIGSRPPPFARVADLLSELLPTSGAANGIATLTLCGRRGAEGGCSVPIMPHAGRASPAGRY